MVNLFAPAKTFWKFMSNLDGLPKEWVSDYLEKNIYNILKILQQVWQ